MGGPTASDCISAIRSSISGGASFCLAGAGVLLGGEVDRHRPLSAVVAGEQPAEDVGTVVGQVHVVAEHELAGALGSGSGRSPVPA